jgi:magnesium chelatase family protein
MLTRVFSAAIQGVEAIQVEIEVNAGSGDPIIVLVGLPDAAVRESKDRVTTAIANSGFRWPRSRTTVNLAPADLRKEGPSFDLPIAMGMIAVAEGTEISRLRALFVGGRACS